MTAPSAAAQSIEDFFSGGAKTAKFEDKAYGSVIGGQITTDPVMRQQRDYETDEPMFYPDGNPQMQMLITVQAQPPTDDDDGQRTFYVRGQLKQAIGEALRKVSARKPERGGRLWVKYLSDEPVVLKNGKRGNDKKIHAAKYEPPAQAAAGQFFDDGGVPATAPSTGTPQALLPCPAGVDPAKWQAMNAQQREQMYDALGLVPPTYSAAAGRQFTEEPPF